MQLKQQTNINIEAGDINFDRHRLENTVKDLDTSGSDIFRPGSPSTCKKVNSYQPAL
jgi:hypothetical protein